MFGLVRSVDPLMENSSFGEADVAAGNDGDEDDVLLFVNEWLSAIADHSIGLVVVQLCQVRAEVCFDDSCQFSSYMHQVPEYSPLGLSQLSVDLDYLK